MALCITDLKVCLCRERLSCPSPLKMKQTKTCLQQCSCFDLSVNMFTECSSAWLRPGRRPRGSLPGRAASLNVSCGVTKLSYYHVTSSSLSWEGISGAANHIPLVLAKRIWCFRLHLYESVLHLRCIFQNFSLVWT